MRVKLLHYKKIGLTMALCWLPLLGFPQETASARLSGTGGGSIPGQKASRQLLKNVLAELGSQYGVSFNYDSDLLREVLVKAPGSTAPAQLDPVLREILSPAGLRYKQVGTNLYVIQAAGDETTPAGNPNAPVRQASITTEMTNPFLLVTGRVTADDGTAMPGVNILVKGTSTGTITDAEGKYSINADPDATLLFSFIGYVSQEVPVNNRSSIDISLKADVKQLGEVVVTALGIKKEAKKLGYAVASVTPEQITVNRTPNFMNALQGKMAGVNITSLGTGPAGTSKVRIRGSRRSAGRITR
jgi:hypothetical protein